MSFAEATGVRAIADGTYAGSIEAGWDIAGNANGGYLMAIAAKAASDATGGRAPVTLTAHFLAPGKPGPVTVDTTIEKQGRRFTTVTARLNGPDRQLMTLLGSYAATPPTTSGMERVDASPPEMPPPEECIAIEPTDTFPPPFMGKVELRIHPDDASFASGTPRFRGWFRLRDDEPIDAFAAIVAVDAFPPTIFNARLPVAWTPTLELTAHLRARPEPGWMRCQFTTRFITGGLLEEDGEVWNAGGRLVAQSRQLALLPLEP